MTQLGRKGLVRRPLVSLFLLTFFLVYGAMHLFVFLRARAAFHPGVRGSLLIALFFLAMIAAPVVVRLSEKAGHEAFARVTAYAGYLWLGLVFLFCSIALAIDLYRLVVKLAALASREELDMLRLAPRTIFLIPLIGSLVICVYGYFEARHITTEYITIRTAKLPAAVDKIRIAQVSDVHLGLIVREERLGLILEQVKAARPDLFVSTGDLVDGQIARLNGLADMLKSVEAPLGKIAVTGNHEFIAGIGQSLEFTELAGFSILRNRAVDLQGIMTVAGVDDPAVRGYLKESLPDEQPLLAGLPRDRFVLLLKHRPLIEPASAGLFDLQLSGHVHRGQIFPFSLVTKLYYPKHAGMMSLNGSTLHVSRGSGTWGPPIRFLAPPEVTVIDIVRDTAGR